MKFSFENFGFIESGSVELADLTLICGPNNVGKTYVSYSIYGFLKHFQRFIDISLSTDQISQLKTEGSITVDLISYLQDFDKYFKDASKEFSDSLQEYFNAPQDFFSGAKIDFSYDNFRMELKGEFKKSYHFGKIEKFVFDKAPDENFLSIALSSTGESKLPVRILNRIVSDAIAECLFSGILPIPFVVTSERTGISLFYKELDLNKNAIFEHLSENAKTDPIEFLNRMRSRYARPIQDNIDVIRDYENISKRKSFLRDEKEMHRSVLDALQDLLGGNFRFLGKQGVIYQPKKERNRDKVNVPVYIASSSIKSLFLIDMYINFLAEKKGLLIIDEPELNLHPENQRKMASLLARLVNAGIKVMVTTHSDYLIREINNRIMLSNDFDNKQEIMKGAKLLEDDILSPNQVKAFSLKSDHSICEVTVDKYGINMANFDQLISDANSLTDSIYYSIED